MARTKRRPALHQLRKHARLCPLRELFLYQHLLQARIAWRGRDHRGECLCTPASDRLRRDPAGVGRGRNGLLSRRGAPGDRDALALDAQRVYRAAAFLADRAQKLYERAYRRDPAQADRRRGRGVVRGRLAGAFRLPEVGTGGESGYCGSNGTRGNYVYEYKGGFLWLETKYENKYGASALGYTKYDKAQDGTMPEVIGGFDLFTVYSGRFTAGQVYAVSSYNGVRVATLKNETDYTNFLDVLYTTDDGAYSTGSFLIGATDVRNEGTFVWTDGTSFNRGGDFNTGEPNNTNGNEDILELINTSYINDNNLHAYVNGVVFEDNQMVLEELTCDYQFKYLSQYAYTSGVVALSSSINLTRFYTMSQVASSDTYEEFVMSEITCSPDTVISKEYYYNWNDLTSGFDSDNELSYPTFDFKNVWIINGLKNYPYPVLRAFSGNIDDYLMEGYELTLEDGNLVDRNGLIYSLDSETKVATVIGIKEEMNTADHEVIILPYVNYNKTNYKVQIIGQGAFKNKHITNYTICDEIIEIEAEAFYKAKFTSFNFPKNLKVIGNAAFFNSSLEQIEITNRLDLIKENAFANCQSLTSASESI